METVINLLALLVKLARVSFIKLLQALPWSFGGLGGSNNDSSGSTKNKNDGQKRDPFEVLGLDGGKDNTTIEEATKARRKLALKWHPDRNIGNEEEATTRMQEINDSFHQIEQILENGGGEDDDDSIISDNYDSESEDEYEDYYEYGGHANKKQGRSKTAKRRAMNRKKRQESERWYDEEAEFSSKMNEEMREFERAQRNAEMGSFASASTSFASKPARSSSTSAKTSSPTNNGTVGEGKSKAAKKRARRRARKKKAFADDIGFPDSPTNASPESIPFHHLSPEKRCEIKFCSSFLVKSPIFTAIRAHTFNVLQMFILVSDVCEPIPLPPKERQDNVFVTPLMIASYLGDYKAAAVIIENAEDRWAEAILAKSCPQGDDCLALAIEAKDIAEQLYEESKAHLNEANTEEDQEMQKTIIEQHSESLEMARKLVERIQSMKQFALEKKRKEYLRSLVEKLVGVLVVGLVGVTCWYCYAWIKHVLGFVWVGVRFCIKYGSILFAFCCAPGPVGIALVLYYYYTKEPSSMPVSDPVNMPATDNLSKFVDTIDIFCSDGETCLVKGDTCNDGISDDILCECGADLKYVCDHTDALLEPTIEIVVPNVDELPSDMPTKTLVDPIDIEPAGMLESLGVGLTLTLIIGWLVCSLWGPSETKGGKKSSKKKRHRRRN